MPADLYWLPRYAPADVIAALEPLLTDERKAKIEKTLDGRLTGLTVLIENLHDPHNGAAAIRSVEGFGLNALHVVESVEPFRFSPKVTQGCEKWVDLRRYKTFDEAASALHGAGFRLYAAVPGAELAIDEIPVDRPAALVFGNEHAGLTGAAQAACDATFAIPMQGFTQSFNLSVSVAMSAFDCSRRRRAALGAPGDLPADERLHLKARWYALSLDIRAAQAIVERAAEGRSSG